MPVFVGSPTTAKFTQNPSHLTVPLCPFYARSPRKNVSRRRTCAFSSAINPDNARPESDKSLRRGRQRQTGTCRRCCRCTEAGVPTVGDSEAGGPVAADVAVTPANPETISRAARGVAVRFSFAPWTPSAALPTRRRPFVSTDEAARRRRCVQASGVPASESSNTPGARLLPFPSEARKATPATAPCPPLPERFGAGEGSREKWRWR